MVLVFILNFLVWHFPFLVFTFIHFANPTPPRHHPFKFSPCVSFTAFISFSSPSPSSSSFPSCCCFQATLRAGKRPTIVWRRVPVLPTPSPPAPPPPPRPHPYSPSVPPSHYFPLTHTSLLSSFFCLIAFLLSSLSILHSYYHHILIPCASFPLRHLSRFIIVIFIVLLPPPVSILFKVLHP